MSLKNLFTNCLFKWFFFALHPYEMKYCMKLNIVHHKEVFLHYEKVNLHSASPQGEDLTSGQDFSVSHQGETFSSHHRAKLLILTSSGQNFSITPQGEISPSHLRTRLFPLTSGWNADYRKIPSRRSLRANICYY